MKKSTRTMQLRPASARLVGRLLAPLTDSGLLTCEEYTIIVATLNNIAKHRESPQVIPPKLITGQEAAEMLGIAYSQFRALEKEGEFPFKRKTIGGKTVRYRLSDVVQYIESEDAIK